MQINRLILVIFFLIAKDITIGTLNAQVHWESMILESDTWRYFPATSEPESNWMQLNYNDSTWPTGPGGFGYADGDDATVVDACNSIYLRRKISLSDAGIVKDLLLDVDYDDAFVLYINGVECARSSNISGNLPAYNAALSVDHEALMYSGDKPERFQLSPSTLVNGENLFALQVLNFNLNSSDLSARVFIQAKINSSSVLFHNTPDWFEEPVSFDSSNLPLIFINTNNQTIIQDSKIMADMKVLNNASGINYLTDTSYEFNGKVGIEIRGFTSAGYPKQSYSVETRKADSSNFNVNLLGLPKENDWVFHGPYSDKSLMRNVLAYNLGNKTGRWSPRTKFFELYINGDYRGIYVLVEKIKIDKNRCDLAKLTTADTTGDDLTGGYILKLDRPEAYDVNGIDYWVSPYRAPTSLLQKEYFLFVDPDGESLVPEQRDYIKNYITDFEDIMYSRNFNDRTKGYYQYVDMQSFVDYYIITELSRNLDGYRISTFLHKDKDSKGGKLTMGPFWDYNICFGNANFFEAGKTAGWVIDGMGDGDNYAMPFWWEKFRLDPYFNATLKQRWNELTSEFINTSYIDALIDSCARVLGSATTRNFTKWDVLSTYVWPNNYVGNTYANELTYLKNWLSDRIEWMDIQIQAIQDTLETVPGSNYVVDMITYPNPFINQVNFKCYMNRASHLQISITDMLGKQVFHYSQPVEPGFSTIPLELGYLKTGVYYYQALVGEKLIKSGKLIKQNQEE